MDLFLEISIIVVIATALSLLMKLLRQPFIVGYIVTGILVGPYFLNLLHSHEEVEFLSKIGISILLFIVGLTLNPEVMREVGKTSLVTGLGQVLFTSVFGYFIIRWLGFDGLAAAYVAIALTFSSTIIILKLLSDRGDTQKLYGKISIGFLLVQDIVATILLLGITILAGTSLSGGVESSNTLLVEVLTLLGKGLVAGVIVYLTSKYALPKIAQFVASSQEVLFTFSLAWGLGMAALFQTIGFSIEIGALIAGATLAVSPFAYEIASRMKPLRDFFIMLFFILLGSTLVVTEISTLIWPAAILSLFVLVGNPLIVLILMNILGYRTRTAFMAGLTVAQISEFSLILIALGLAAGHVSQEVVSLVTLVGVITIAGSTYLILYAEKIYRFLKPVLKLMVVRKSHMEEKTIDDKSEIIIFGFDRVGSHFVETARAMTEKFLVVDFNPLSIKRMEEANIPYKYGDAEDVEFLEEINFTDSKLVVSTIPDLETNLLLVSFYRQHNAEGVFIAISHDMEGARELYGAGASFVVMPHHLGAFHAATLINKHGFNQEAFAEEKKKHLESLERFGKDYVKRPI
jgi:Kef-type K+ transport system membrane component KefB/Trk K+ transport system NAD-binding subunit